MRKDLWLEHPKNNLPSEEIDWQWPEAIDKNDKRYIDEILDLGIRKQVLIHYETLFILKHVYKVLECYLSTRHVKLFSYLDYIHFLSNCPMAIPGDASNLDSDYLGCFSSYCLSGNMPKEIECFVNTLKATRGVGLDWDRIEDYKIEGIERVDLFDAIDILRRYVYKMLHYRMRLEALRFIYKHQHIKLDDWMDPCFPCIGVELSHYKSLIPEILYWHATVSTGYKIKHFPIIELQVKLKFRERPILIRDAPRAVKGQRPRLDKMDNKHEFTEPERINYIEKMMTNIERKIQELDIGVIKMHELAELKQAVSLAKLQALYPGSPLKMELEAVMLAFPGFNRIVGIKKGYHIFYIEDNILKLYEKNPLKIAEALTKECDCSNGRKPWKSLWYLSGGDSTKMKLLWRLVQINYKRPVFLSLVNKKIDYK